MSKKITRYNRRIDKRPRCNVHRSNMVSGANEPALNTFEIIPIRPISCFVMFTFGANMRSTSRIDQYYWNPRKFRFILDKIPKLIESPRMVLATLRLFNPYLVANARQIFECNRSTSVFSFSHNILGDAMVNVTIEFAYFTRELLEMSFGTLSACPLEFTFEFCHLTSNFINPLSAMNDSIAINRKIDYAQIDAKGFGSFNLLGFGNIDHDTEIEYSFDEYEVCLSPDSIQAGFVVIADKDWYDDSAFECQYGYSIKGFPSQNAWVINHSPMRFEFGLGGFISFIGFDCLGNGSNRHLSGKSELLSNIVIDKFVEENLIGFSMLKSNFSDIITGFVKSFHSGFESFELFVRSIKLNLNRQVHNIDNIVQCIYTYWGGFVESIHSPPNHSKLCGIRMEIMR